MAEKDIGKFEASSAAPGHGPGASQHTGERAQHRYQPYERCEPKITTWTDQHQPRCQFARGKGRRGHANPHFSKFHGFNSLKPINDNHSYNPTNFSKQSSLVGS